MHEGLVLEESAALQGVHEASQHGLDIVFAGQLPEGAPQVELVVISVEESEQGDEGRGDDQDLVRVEQRVADQEPGPIGDRRRHEIEAAP